MKRLLALTLTLAMTLGICAGCGSKPADGGSTAAPDAAAPAPAESAEPEEEAEAPAADTATGEKMTIGMACINLNDAGLILIKNGADLAGEDYDCELMEEKDNG